MWMAIKRKVALPIGFPTVTLSEDVYFGPLLEEYCKKHSKKTILLRDLYAQHHHITSFKKFIRQKWLYGQNAVLIRWYMKRYTLPLALVLFAISISLIALLSLKFLLIYIVLSLLGFTLYKRKRWGWILKYYGVKVTIACIFISLIGNTVSILSMYRGLLGRKKVRVLRGA